MMNSDSKTLSGPSSHPQLRLFSPIFLCTGCPTKPYPLCIWVIMNCKIVQFPHETIHFKADVLRTKTSTYSFLRYKQNQRYNQNKFSFKTIQNNKKGPVSGFVGVCLFQQQKVEFKRSIIWGVTLLLVQHFISPRKHLMSEGR